MADNTQITWNADSIIAFIEAHRDELQAMGVQKIGLFGSYARGEQTPESDIDVLLTLDDWTWRKWCGVWNFLEDAFGVKIDLVPEENLRKELHAYVFPEVRYAEGF